MEPNPGPNEVSNITRRSITGLPSSGWTPNCGGAKGTWNALDIVLQDRPCFAMLQVAAFTKSEADHFASKAKKQGFMSYFSGAICEGPRPCEETMFLVRNTCKSQPAWRHGSRGGAAQAMYVDGNFFMSTYMAPEPEACDILHEVANVVLSLPSRITWCAGGDFNMLAHLLHDQCDAFAKFTSSGTATRWDGRCIDYFLVSSSSNIPRLLSINFRITK